MRLDEPKPPRGSYATTKGNHDTLNKILRLFSFQGIDMLGGLSCDSISRATQQNTSYSWRAISSRISALLRLGGIND